MAEKLNDAEAIKLVERILEVAYPNVEDRDCSSDWHEFSYLKSFVHLDECYEYKDIQNYGGGEGGDEYCYKIFSWKDVNDPEPKFYRMDYNYYSYVGSNFDDVEIYQVTPVDKVVTQYE